MEENDAFDHTAASPAQGEIRHACTSEDISTLDLVQRTAQYQSELIAELQPRSTLARILVAQLGRHAAGMDLGSASEAATFGFASQNEQAHRVFACAEPAQRPFLAAMGSDLVAAASRFQARHERGFFSTLRELREVSRANRQPPDVSPFADEEACIVFLARWHQERSVACQNCGRTERYFLPSCARYECNQCHRQSSVREGTIFARSKLPLIAWFNTVYALSTDPELPLTELAQRVPVVRHATLRKMRDKVLAALSSSDAENLLAGLPAYLMDHLFQVYRQQHIQSKRKIHAQGDIKISVHALSPSPASLKGDHSDSPATKPAP